MKLEIIFNIILIYLLLSFFEWYIHKNFMHKNDNNLFITMFDKIYIYIYSNDFRKSHIEHHKKNNNDGNIDNDEGATFSSSYKFITPLLLIIPYYLVTKIIFNYSVKTYSYFLLLFFIIAWIYEILWNCFHLKYHRWEDNFNEKGIIENNFIYKYLEKYHMIHHFNKSDNKCNYNIVLPGMDHIMGNYKGCVDNKEFCKKHKFDSPKNIEICKNEEMNIKLPYGIEYCN
tara:strand:+ start:154 stop:840 length:687 start_codon:yes stop_codon:yes gene_type:complete